MLAGDEEAVTVAVKKYVGAHSVVWGFHILIEKIDGDYARVKVTPNDASQTDAAWVFLKRENGVWRGLTIGTAFSPDDYKALHIPVLFSSRNVVGRRSNFRCAAVWSAVVRRC